MPPLVSAFQPHSNPPITPFRHDRSSTLSVDSSLIPPPLRTPSFHSILDSNGCRIDRYFSRKESPKDYSQKLVRRYSLGLPQRQWRSNVNSEVFYKCTLCFHQLPKKSKPYVLPSDRSGSNSLNGDDDKRIFCEDCWKWIYNLSICWTCGEIVGRMEERVGFGWCWWHWGCLGCLMCKVSI